MGEVVDLKTRKPVLPPPRTSREALDDLYAGRSGADRLFEEVNRDAATSREALDDLYAGRSGADRLFEEVNRDAAPARV